MRATNKKIWLGIFILISLEQIIKLIINANFLDKTYPIFPPFLYFEPMFNRNYSWFDSLFNVGASKGLHILVVALLSVTLYLFYRFLNSRFGSNKYMSVMFAFVFSGAMCSLIDKIFWNGSLDYILVSGLFTFDLKDVYINVFNGLLILSLFIENSILKQLEEKNLFKDFTRYLLRKS